MCIASYSDLQTSMGKWLKRPDLASLFPDFIMLAEQNFERVIKTKSRRNNWTTTPTISVLPLPTDWDRVIRAYYNGTTLGFYPNDFTSQYNNLTAILGTGPVAINQIHSGYQIQGDNFILSVDQLGGLLSVDYYTIIQSLSSINTTNWLLQDAPDVYLFGSLHEAALYIRDDDGAALWMQKRDAGIQAMLQDDDLSRTPEQPLVIRRG